MKYAALLLATCLVLATSAQPWVPPEFNSPAGSSDNIETPSRLSDALIMGVCTVSVLFTAFLVMTVIVCTYKEKVKEIDLNKPLILTSEVGKKKKRKDNKKSKADNVDGHELDLSVAPSHETMELPPRNGSPDADLGMHVDSDQEEASGSENESYTE